MRDLPAQRRGEILDEIEEHIAAGLAELPAPTEADARNVLERVGDPEDIAAEARERFGIKPARRRWTDPAAIVLLLISGFTIIGTLIVPDGLAGALGGIRAFRQHLVVRSTRARCDSCRFMRLRSLDISGRVELILGALVVIAPIVTAAYLAEGCVGPAWRATPSSRGRGRRPGAKWVRPGVFSLNET